jgi:MFS family permease
MTRDVRVAGIAWLLAAVYYFHQYALRSAPAVMVPQLSDAFSLSAVGVASLAGLFYWGYSPFSLVAGAALDRFGARAVIPAGAFMTAAGALLFATGDIAAAYAGRFLQGAGGVFALIGAVYIAGNHFPASRAATLIGATQMFGMAGGSAGQFVVGPLIAAGVVWNSFWLVMGLAGLLIAVTLLVLIPARKTEVPREESWIPGTLRMFSVVFRNPQSILCGLIAGLLFIPTTIFDMMWGVRFLQEAHGFPYGEAVLRSATVPLGWIVGSPLLGLASDRLGRRKPVIAGGATVLLGCLTWILVGPAGWLPPYVLGFVTGVASGTAMLAYTVVKEANPPHLAGTAMGVINFVNFTFSALLGPVFGRLMQRAARTGAAPGEQYQTTFLPLLYGVAAAIFLTLLLKETGPAARAAMVRAEAA